LAEVDGRAKKGLQELGGETDRLGAEIAQLKRDHAAALAEEQGRSRASYDALAARHQAELAACKALASDASVRHQKELDAVEAARLAERASAQSELEVRSWFPSLLSVVDDSPFRPL
jgi:hypothetical protein